MVELARPRPNEKEARASVVALMEKDEGLVPEAKEKLRAALDQSGGKAGIIVHPFYLETDRYAPVGLDPDNRHYDQYKDRLKNNVARYRDLGLPLILFEKEEAHVGIPLELERLGIADGEIFVVDTFPEGASPANWMSLNTLGGELLSVGLNRASVIGSYLVSESSSDVRDPFLFGCVGSIIEQFRDKGLNATRGFATYPPRFK